MRTKSFNVPLSSLLPYVVTVSYAFVLLLDVS